MSIRYQCDECGSVLKVKDELAGTAGKCPKCKKKFVVPQPDGTTAKPATKPKAPADKEQPKSAAPKTPSAAASKPAPAREEKSTPSKEQAAPPAAKKKAEDDDFDVDAFLMEDGPVATPPPAGAGPAAGGASTTAGRPGRKRIVPPTPGDDPMEPARGGEGGTDASANARDLLSKNMDDARVKASAMPEEKPKEPFFDFSGVRQEAKQALPYIGGFIVLLLLVWWMSNAIFGSNLNLPPLARVSGTVTVGGNPLPNVRVNLTPVDRKVEINGKEMRPRTASGVTDKDGYFDLQYQQDVKGAYIGKSRIWVEPLDPKDMSKIPGRYLSISNDIREVKEAGNDGKFNLEFE